MIAPLGSSRSFDRPRYRAVIPTPARPVLADRPRQTAAEAAVIHLADHPSLAPAAMAALIDIQAGLA